MIDYYSLNEKYSSSIEELSSIGKFKCPLCGNTIPIEEGKEYVKRADVALTGYSSFGGVNVTQKTETYHVFRICNECSRKNDKAEKILFIVGAAIFCIIVSIFAYYYFCVQYFWMSNLSFITKDLAERSIWSFLGWCALLFPIYFLVYYYATMICRNFFTSVQNTTFEEAYKSNAIVRKNPKNVKKKFYVPQYN